MAITAGPGIGMATPDFFIQGRFYEAKIIRSTVVVSLRPALSAMQRYRRDASLVNLWALLDIAKSDRNRAGRAVRQMLREQGIVDIRLER